jgi:hypothetical protein
MIRLPRFDDTQSAALAIALFITRIVSGIGLRLIQSQVGTPLTLVRTMTLKTQIREDGANIAIELRLSGQLAERLVRQRSGPPSGTH